MPESIEPVLKAPKMADGASTQAAIKSLHKDGSLSAELASKAMHELMGGTASPAQMGAFLSLLSTERCTSDIVHALADVMRSNAITIDVPRSAGPIVDIVGTGGDGQNTFNISTAAAFVAAAGGAQVVKHGNRAASSSCGAADVLEASGARLDLSAAEVPAVLEAARFAFVFARSFHPAMKHVGPVRSQLGIRTVFNILGPLTNPAKPDCMLAGVYSPSLGRLYAEVFKMLGMKRALVVHGLEVLDELSIAGPSKVWELCADGNIKEYEVTPLADFGVPAHPLAEVASGSVAENAAELKQLFAGGGREAVKDMVRMNAGAALYLVGLAADFKAGVALATAVLADGRAAKSLDAYITASQPK